MSMQTRVVEQVLVEDRSNRDLGGKASGIDVRFGCGAAPVYETGFGSRH